MNKVNPDAVRVEKCSKDNEIFWQSVQKIYLCCMLRIVTHIERLLLVHDCVIVPKFGGFVLQVVPAVRRVEEHTFCPLRKEMIFHPGETDLFSVGSYGLPVFHFPALLSVQKEKKDTLYIPISRKLIRTAMVSAAAVALFLLVSTPVKEVNQEAYTASFVPTGMVVQKPVLLEAVLPDSTVAEADTKQESSEEVIAREVKKAASAPVAEKKAAVSKPVVVQPKKMYHIVIASFPSESQADEFIAGVDRNECKHVSKVVRDGKYRIYADKFDNREAAESYMQTLRSNPRYKDAWLFISR